MFRYNDVLIYAVVEHHHYHQIIDDGTIGEVVEYDHAPEIIAWSIYSEELEIEEYVETTRFATLDRLKVYIDELIANKEKK